MIRGLRSWLQYRAEKRMLERNPYDYIRFVLGMPDATDEELDATAEQMGEAIRAAGISTAEATEGFAAVIRASGDPPMLYAD